LDKSDTEAETMPAIPGYAHLAQDPGYNGGAPRVAAVGVRVYSIWLLHQAGWSPEKISEEYEQLSIGAVHSALAYAADHEQEMNAYLEEDRRGEAEFRKNHPLDPKLKAALERTPVLPR
jgi:uncharacterized protein (DUF433 family)